jgi:GNAT superfamily N-acetyltransferase
MPSPVQFEAMDEEEISSVSALVREVFLDVIAPHYTDEGQQTFLSYVAPEVWRSRLANGHEVFVARVGGRLAGMLELRERRHLSLLFVRRKYQGQGVARGLLAFAMEVAPELQGQAVTVLDLDQLFVSYARGLG